MQQSGIQPLQQSYPSATAAGFQKDAAPRFDIYRLVHKGLRAFMSDVSNDVGRMDYADEHDVATTLARVRELLEVCASHLQKENRYIHPAMEARQPGSTVGTAKEHAEHEQAFIDLEELACVVENSDGVERAAAVARLYRELALFVAENFLHMQVEETWNNAVLWKTYDDTELAALQRELVASLPPQQARAFLRWMLPAATPRERALLLADMKRNAPPAVFSDTLTMLRSLLSARDWEKLRVALRV